MEILKEVTNMWDSGVFDKALFFAFDAHKSQEMKDPEGMPYSAHLVGVLSNAIKYSYNDTNVDWDLLVQFALLHDVIEDTHFTHEDIEKEFGKRVADGVGALSKNEGLPKLEQMKECIERIKSQPREVAIVKLADRLFNMRTNISSWSSEKREFYKWEGQLICNELGYASETLKNALQETINKYNII